MKKVVLLIFLAASFTISLNAQKKLNLYIQLTGELDVSDDLNFRFVTPPNPSSKKVKVLSIDSLIDFDAINAVIKKMDYKGLRILNELSLVGWKLESSVAAAQVEGKVFGGPRVIFILSKEFVIEEKSIRN